MLETNKKRKWDMIGKNAERERGVMRRTKRENGRASPHPSEVPLSRLVNLTPYLRSCYSALVPVFKTVINLSLSTGSMLEDLKIASLRPLLKKPNADCEQFSNFRPVSNLKFLSKLVEKSVFVQLNNYLTVNGLH